MAQGDVAEGIAIFNGIAARGRLRECLLCEGGASGSGQKCGAGKVSSRVLH